MEQAAMPPRRSKRLQAIVDKRKLKRAQAKEERQKEARKRLRAQEERRNPHHNMRNFLQNMAPLAEGHDLAQQKRLIGAVLSSILMDECNTE
jgi:hypothetical protein